MIHIIEKGTKQKTQCSECGCIFSFEKEDIEFVDWTAMRKTIKCPQCNYINKGYLTAKTDKESDEVYTPSYAIIPLLKYVKKSDIIWCPFDTEDSEYVKIFKENGNKVIYSHIDL